MRSARVKKRGLGGMVMEIEQGAISKEKLYLVQYDDGEVEHFTRKQVLRHLRTAGGEGESASESERRSESESNGGRCMSTDEAHEWGSCGWRLPGAEVRTFKVDPNNVNINTDVLLPGEDGGGLEEEAKERRSSEG